jgi:polyhydroxybutyrate depolymerase
MLRRALSAAALFLLPAGAFAQSQTLQVAGKARTYILHAPTGLAANPPLVFVIHGFNMSGQQEVTLTRMNTVADREKFVVVYPNALPNAQNQQSWDLSGPDDYAFLLAIIDTVEARHHIDRKRVYASGFSQGGFLSFQLGCRHSEGFAAIAPVSGTFQNPAACSPKRPVPMILTFGTNEGFSVDGFIKSGTDWMKLNGCNATPAVQKPYPPANASSVVTRSTYTSCKEGAEVVTQSVEGGTHEWPMDTRTKVNNSEEVWAFFKRFSLQGPTAIPRRPGPAAAEGIRAGLVPGGIALHGIAAGSRISVYDIRGNRIPLESAGKGEASFRAEAGGVYSVRGGHAGRDQVLKVVMP